MDSKKVIVSITDVDTGEVLGCVNYFNHHLKKVVPLSKAKDISRSWFDSFIRGLDTSRNLELTITVKDCKQASSLTFEQFANIYNV